MTQLYSDAITEKRRKRSRFTGMLAAGIAAAGLIACIVMCCLTETGNAAAMERNVILTAVLSGWISIFIYLNVYESLRRDYMHSRLLAACEKPEVFTGRLEFTGRNADIKGSVSVCGLVLTDGDGRHLLNVERSRAGKLRNIKGKVKVNTAHGYVTAYEELGDENN